MDRVVRALLPGPQLTLSVAVVTQTVEEARSLHQLKPASAAIFAEAVAAGVLMASLQKEQTRLNLQLECDGPLRGLFVDAGSDGTVRGYAKNPWLEGLGAPGEFRWRPVLGNGGFLSVLRDVGTGEFYRSSVQLEALSLARDLNRYFQVSEQVATRVALFTVPAGDGLSMVAGALLQALPGGDEAMLAKAGEGLGALLEAKVAQTPQIDAETLALALAPASGELTVRNDVRWACSCSKARVLNMLQAMGQAELEGLIAERHGAVVKCEFCGRRHEATEAELQALIAGLAPS